MIYGYGDYETNVDPLTDTGLKLKLKGKTRTQTEHALDSCEMSGIIVQIRMAILSTFDGDNEDKYQNHNVFYIGAGCIWGSLVLWIF